MRIGSIIPWSLVPALAGTSWQQNLRPPGCWSHQAVINRLPVLSSKDHTDKACVEALEGKQAWIPPWPVAVGQF